MEVYEIVKSIGSGSFGQVYLCRHKREDKYYVMKKIKTRDMNAKDRENTEQEVRLLQKLRHSNIVSYKDSFLDKEQYLNIVMIYCEGGDMYNKIKNMKGKAFTENQILDWLVQMSLALFYLHDKKILHRDLKTQNIFLKHDRVRLGDFGIAKVLDSTRDFANTCIGTPYYMSPELFKYKPYSYKSDVWALGCCLYEMCNLRHAFDAQSLNGLAVKILKGSYPPISTNYSKPLRELINKMLSINPKQRPTILDVLNKSFIKKRVITYFNEILSGNYPEANLPHDVDDIYIDSLKEQAEKLGILVNIKDNITNFSSDQEKKDNYTKISSTENIEKSNKDNLIKQDSKLRALELQRKKQKSDLNAEVQEKIKLEEEIKKLEQKKKLKTKKNLLKKNSITDISHPKEKKIKITAKTKSQVQKEKDRKNEELKKKNDNIIDSEFLPQKIQYLEENINEESGNFTKKLSDDKKEFLDKREKVLYEKEKKKKEEQDKWEEQFRLISMQNFQARKLANEKKNAQYRPSSGMKELIEKKEEDKKFKIQEDYDMNDESNEEDEIIFEEDNEEEDEQIIENKINSFKNKINEKTAKISELKESLKKTMQILEKSIRPYQNEDSQEENKSYSVDELLEVSDDLEDESDLQILIEEDGIKENINPQQEKIKERLKLLKHRCEAGLGNTIFNKAFNFVKENKNKLKNEEMRKLLSEILGEEFIGFWHLIDQILIFEQINSEFCDIAPNQYTL